MPFMFMTRPTRRGSVAQLLKEFLTFGFEEERSAIDDVVRKELSL
jgi:hypothetical protein